MATTIQTVAGAVQFTGVAGAGLVDFGELAGLPRTTRAVLSTVAVHIDGACDRIDVYLVRPGGPASARVLLGRGLAPDITGPDGDTDFTVCGRVDLREGEGAPPWRLVVTTVGKAADGTLSVDVLIQPFPETTARDA